MSQEKPKTYTAEFRASAVKLANEIRPTHSANSQGTGCQRQYAAYLDWQIQAGPNQPIKPYGTDEHLYDELKRLKKENAR